MIEIGRILGLELRCRGQRLQFDRCSSSECLTGVQAPSVFEHEVQYQYARSLIVVSYGAADRESVTLRTTIRT